MGKRFAILIGVAAAGVMALGAQTVAAAPEVVNYETKSVIDKERGLIEGRVHSEVRKCMGERRVVVFKVRSGADRKLATARTQFKYGRGDWGVTVRSISTEGLLGDVLYAKVLRKVGDGFVCLADRSATMKPPACHCRGQTATSTTGPVDRVPPDLRISGDTTAAAPPEVVKYRTRLLITTERDFLHHGRLLSDRDRNPGYDPAHAVRKCMAGRRVTVFKQRPGADRKVGTRRSYLGRGLGIWGAPRFVKAPGQAQVYAKVRREVHDEFVCRGDRSDTI